MARIGLMLYTVRDECARDFEGALRAVAEIGYEGVELYDFHGCEPVRVRAWLDEFGLVAVGRHASLDVIEPRLAGLAAEAAALGTSRLVLNWLDPSTLASEGDLLVERLASVAAEAALLGLEFGFHNHDAELRPLADGSCFLDRLLQLPLFFEIDLGWAWWAGIDPAALLERLRGRVPLVHVKDFATRDQRSFRPVGDGNVGYERVAPAAVAAGVDWLLVEQDEVDGSTLEAARRSLSALARLVR